MHARLLTDDDISAAARVMLELRPQYALDALVERIRLQRAAHDYRLAATVDELGHILCIAGFVIQHKLAWGKSLYVDDLVTTEGARSSGAGRCLMAWLKTHARDQGCEQLHLDSGVQRFDAHRFYLQAGFRIASHHFSLELKEAHTDHG